MTTASTFGTSDLFYLGHVRLFEQLRKLDNPPIVVYSTDERGGEEVRTSVYSFEERADILVACQYVGRIFPENDWTQKGSDIVACNVDIFAMRDDWSGEFDELSKLVQGYHPPRTENVSTTATKSLIFKRQKAAQTSAAERDRRYAASDRKDLFLSRAFELQFDHRVSESIWAKWGSVMTSDFCRWVPQISS